MLSNRIYKFVSLSFPIFSFFGISVYTWQPTRKIFVHNFSKSYFTFPEFNLCFLYVWCAFYVLQIARFYNQDNINYLIFSTILLGGLGVTAISFYLSIIKAQHFFLLINWALIFLRYINSK